MVWRVNTLSVVKVPPSLPDTTFVEVAGSNPIDPLATLVTKRLVPPCLK